MILPASLMTIEAEAFTGTAVEEVVIRNDYTTIQSGAFAGCGSLEVIVFYAMDCTIEDGAIPAGVGIIAPAGGSVEAWAAENGVTFQAR